MAFLIPINANRGGSRHSTGVRPPDEKPDYRSRCLVDCRNAAGQDLAGDDLAEFNELLAAYYGEHQPATPAERYFTLSLVLCDWRRRRYASVEAEMLSCLAGQVKAEGGSKGGAGRELVQSPSAFARLYQANDRAYERALKALARLQAGRMNPAGRDISG